MDLVILVATSAVGVLGTQFLKLLLGKVSDKYGALMAQISLLAISLLLGAIASIVKLLPANIVETTGAIFLTSMGIYEVLYKNIYKKVIRG